jgi:hypothetical protein
METNQKKTRHSPCLRVSVVHFARRQGGTRRIAAGVRRIAARALRIAAGAVRICAAVRRPAAWPLRIAAGAVRICAAVRRPAAWPLRIAAGTMRICAGALRIAAGRRRFSHRALKWHCGWPMKVRRIRPPCGPFRIITPDGLRTADHHRARRLHLATPGPSTNGHE